MGLSVDVPLLSKRTHQSQRRRVVALPVGGSDINERETGLSIGVSLLGQGAQQSRRRFVIALPVGGTSILKRPSSYRATGDDGKHQSDDGCLEGAVHLRMKTCGSGRNVDRRET
jgi:hypothetical protein